MEAIIIDNLTKRFGDIVAVDRLSLSVQKGELFGLVGSDGAGKTTTIRMLTGIMDPSDGDAWVMGLHTVKDAEPLKNDIGYMSRRFALYNDLTVMENIHFYADIYGIPVKGRAEKVEKLLAFSNLTPFKRRSAGNLSGGMKQKLGLACVLIHTPKILFLDEPTNGVDPVSRRDFRRILYQLIKEGTTIFVSTAYLDEADHCNRVGLMHKGKLLACDTPERLRELISESILELRASEPRRAARILREQFPAASVGLFGDRIHLITSDPDSSIELIGKSLKSEGIELSGIRQIEPSLEDVFVSVMKQEDVT